MQKAKSMRKLVQSPSRRRLEKFDDQDVSLSFHSEIKLQPAPPVFTPRRDTNQSQVVQSGVEHASATLSNSCSNELSPSNSKNIGRSSVNITLEGFCLMLT